MYAEQYAPLKKKNADTKTNSTAGNPTGIPMSLKNRFEAVGGLSFDDVRVHYNSKEPAKLGALAYTRGNQVYIGRGQEKHLEHELVHVIQQKRGLVKPDTHINGLPVNTDQILEQQAESRAVTFGRAVYEGGQEVVQGIFLKRDDKSGLLVKAKEDGDVCLDTSTAKLVDLFRCLGELQDPGLIPMICKDINNKIQQCTLEEFVFEILKYVRAWEDNAVPIICKMDGSVRQWLFKMADEFVKNNKTQGKYFIELAKWLLEQLHMAPNIDSADQLPRAYADLMSDIKKLGDFIGQVAGNGDIDDTRRHQLAILIGWKIIGYQKLCDRYKDDAYISKVILGELNTLIDHFNDNLGNKYNIPIKVLSTGTPGSVIALNAYAREKQQETVLPSLDQLPEVLNKQPLFERNTVDANGKEKNYTDFDEISARNLLICLASAKSPNKLVIFRSMNEEEAISILRFFNSTQVAQATQAALAEAEILSGSFKIHGNGPNPLIAPLGRHYGEYSQASQYDGGESDIKHVNVTLAFILKPGASELLFSSSLIAIPSSTRSSINKDLGEKRDSFQKVTDNEGTIRGYIGIKHEQDKSSGVSKPTYSLGVANGMDTRLLLQLLIDRVEVVNIRLNVKKKFEKIVYTSPVKYGPQQQTSAQIRIDAKRSLTT